MIPSPCKDCKDRHIEPVNCHSECSRYIEFRKSRDKELEERNKRNDTRNMIIGCQIDGIKRMKRSKRKTKR